ncbi:MAG: SLC13 family permease [Lachnospiraceae bacterium]|nr:SLC13 family permease [Lachnospiraceae bacterium]
MKNKVYVHYLVALILFLLILLALPAGNGLTSDGVHLLAVIVPIIYMWITVGTDWVSLLALAGIVMTGVMTNGSNFYASVYSGSMGNFIIITVITCMALSEVLGQTGVIAKIANWFITRKFCQGRPYMFLAMFILSFFVIGTFMEATAAAIMYISLAQEICDKLGYKKGDPFYTVMMCGIYWGNAVVSAGSPISHVLPLLLIAAAAPALGVTISFGQWLMVGIPFEILAYLALMLVVCVFWKPEADKFGNYDIEEMKKSSPPLSTEGKITSIIFAIVVFVWLFPQFGKSLLPGAVTYLNNIGACVPPILALALICIIHINGKPIAKFPELVKNIPMGLLIFTATVTVMGSAINLEGVGISTWLSNILSPALSGLPTLAVMALLVFGSLAVSQFMSDTVTMYLFYAIAIALLAASGINMPAFVIVVGLAAIMGILTPAAAVSSPLFFGPEHITMGNTTKYALIYLGIIFAVLMVIIWPLASAIIQF